MKIKKFIIVLFRVLQGILLAFLLFVGMGCMPSIMGMMVLMLAVLVTPRKMLDFMIGDWFSKCVWIFVLLYYLCAIPEADITASARNMANLFLRIWGAISPLLGK